MTPRPQPAATALALLLVLLAAAPPARADYYSRNISSPMLTVGLGFTAGGEAAVTAFPSSARAP